MTATIIRGIVKQESLAVEDKLFRQDALNVHVSVPCPLKVRLKIELERFIEQYNQTHCLPVHCPTIMEGTPHSVEDVMHEATSADQLPDVWVTNSFHTSFAQPFKQRFIDSGIYTGVTRPEWLPLLPPQFKKLADENNIGFLAFGSWSVVCDTAFNDDMPIPATWSDMALPAFQGKIGIHGCHSHATGTSLLMILRERLGEEGVRHFASNLRQISHFSKIIKAMDSGDASRPYINIMPSSAIQQIPSKKRVSELLLRDGPILTPVMLFVKTDKLDMCQDIIAFFWGNAFRDVLAKGDIRMPDQMNWSQPYALPDLDLIASRDFNQLSDELDVIFRQGLPADLIV